MAAEPKPSPIDSSLMGRRILVIEDHADSRDFLATSFRLVGARVYAVGTLTEASARLRPVPADLVVSDVKLPDGTGLEFVVWLRARRKDQGRDIPCLALTGFEPHPGVAPSASTLHAEAGGSREALQRCLCLIGRRSHEPEGGLAGMGDVTWRTRPVSSWLLAASPPGTR